MVAVSQRIARYDYPENITLAPYALVALGITYSPLRFPKLTLILTVDNLLNQTYQATHGYPEPGRSLSLTIVYQPSLKKRSPNEDPNLSLTCFLLPLVKLRPERH